MLDDLDRYLESKGYRFARYADDFVINVKSLQEGEHVKTEVTAYLKTLKLPINTEKSQVVSSKQLCFLGLLLKVRRLSGVRKV